MIESYKTIEKAAESETVVKKSRFIANVFPVESETEALGRIEEMKKKYYDARHNCYAYQVGRDCGLMRYSDDGEPQGTAGIPMLDILRNEKITNTVVIVTRYFGGILLGTGGLVRAYSKAAKEGLLAGEVVTRTLYTRIYITVDYNLHGKIQYMLLNKGHIIEDTEFTDKVKIKVGCLAPLKDKLLSEIVEVTQGRAHTEAGESYYM